MQVTATNPSFMFVWKWGTACARTYIKEHESSSPYCSFGKVKPHAVAHFVARRQCVGQTPCWICSWLIATDWNQSGANGKSIPRCPPTVAFAVRTQHVYRMLQVRNQQCDHHPSAHWQSAQPNNLTRTFWHEAQHHRHLAPNIGCDVAHGNGTAKIRTCSHVLQYFISKCKVNFLSHSFALGRILW